MTTIRSVLWQNPYDRSTDLCRLTHTAAGWILQGTVLIPVEGEPARCDYRAEADEGWNTRRVHLRLGGPDWERELELDTSDGRWRVDGRHEPSLDGCTDVDLRVTPATNILPIRRQPLDIGEQASVTAAWVGFPDLQVHTSEQSYERLGANAYRYRSGDFVADLDVDDVGLVLHYAEEYWQAVATR